MEKELSAGFIVRNNKGQFLACHCSGRKFENCTYDIPKGHVEDGESDLDAAKRELLEEAGIDYKQFDCEIIDAGVQPYLKTKDLHVFILNLNGDIPIEEMQCSTYFDIEGKQIPEVNGYMWVDTTECYFKSLQKVFNKLKSQNIL